MKNVEIPGGTAQLREKSDVRKRHQRLVEVAVLSAAPALVKIEKLGGEKALASSLSQLDLTENEVKSILHLQDATILAVLDSWTRPEPVPTTCDDLEDLPTEVYDALAQVTSGVGSELVHSEDFEPSDPKASGFTETPTSPSADSEPGLRDITEPELIPAPSNSGTSTDIAPSSED